MSEHMDNQNETKLYPVTEDHGDRFQRMWEAYHQYDVPTYLSPLIGAVLGLFAAVVVAVVGVL